MFHQIQFNTPQKSQTDLTAEANSRLLASRSAATNLLSAVRGFGTSVSSFFKKAADKTNQQRLLQQPTPASQFTPQFGPFKIPIPNVTGAVATSEPVRAQFVNNASTLQQKEEALMTPAPRELLQS